MRRLLARILLMSDPHGMVTEPGTQRGQIVKGGDRFFEGWINEQKKRNNAIFFPFIRSFQSSPPFDHLISLGDLIECVWNEQGILVPRDIKGIKIFKAAVEMNIPVKKENMHFLPGDHELGYRLPLSVDPKCGMSSTSIENFQRILGPLFDAWRIGNFHFITISSSLFSQSTEHLKYEERKEIESLRKEQIKFVIEYLLNVIDGQKVFLFLHDPDAIETINRLPGAERITRIFCGHIHTDKLFEGYQQIGRASNSFWGRLLVRFFFLIMLQPQKAGKIITWAKGNPRRLALFEKYNLQRVPSSSVLHGGKPGFLVLELYDNGKYEIKKFTA